MKLGHLVSNHECGTWKLPDETYCRSHLTVSHCEEGKVTGVYHSAGVKSASHDPVSTHVAPRCLPPPQRGCCSVSGTADDSGKLSHLCNMGSRVRWTTSQPSQTRHFSQSYSHKRWDTGEIVHIARYAAHYIVIIQLTGCLGRCGCSLKGASCKRS